MYLLTHSLSVSLVFTISSHLYSEHAKRSYHFQTKLRDQKDFLQANSLLFLLNEMKENGTPAAELGLFLNQKKKKSRLER